MRVGCFQSPSTSSSAALALLIPSPYTRSAPRVILSGHAGRSQLLSLNWLRSHDRDIDQRDTRCGGDSPFRVANSLFFEFAVNNQGTFQSNTGLTARILSEASDGSSLSLLARSTDDQLGFQLNATLAPDSNVAVLELTAVNLTANSIFLRVSFLRFGESKLPAIRKYDGRHSEKGDASWCRYRTRTHGDWRLIRWGWISSSMWDAECPQQHGSG